MYLTGQSTAVPSALQAHLGSIGSLIAMNNNLPSGPTEDVAMLLRS